MDVPDMPRIRGQWEEFSVGSWCEGDTCVETLLDSQTTIWEDGTWERVASDPRNPRRQFTQRSTDADAVETAEDLLTRFRAYAELPVPVKRRR